MSVSFRRLTSRWRDPRLAVGVLLIVLSGAAGGMILSGPQTSPVYQAKNTLLPGSKIDSSNLVLVDINPSLAESYIGPSDIDEESIIANTIHKGELVTKSNLRSTDISGTRVVIPLGAGVPSQAQVGDTVTLWKVDKHNMSGGEAEISLLSEKATLVSLSNSDGIVEAGQSAELLVPKDEASAILEVLGTDSLFVITTGGVL